ncbi:hypothetical protein [Fusobacterium ulcerans]|uniref:Uncharacterized protein n=3 Tax=Fusobacterium ulcerans TaxID=861 RepID=H1PYR0_9FUSO|nr:hypothetical protein [Fusobacterium ulcerans]EHO77249.1 hypothetical protein HMPREF0402_03553 [Fusobacterium ulcerans 12-1B]
MSNTSKGLAEKGSKYWMQMIINSELKLRLNDFLKDDINWLCPLKDKDNYSEYELRQEKIVKETKITKDKYKEFWPPRQPQWDAIGISDNRKTLYLVEAKAHLKELKSNISAGEESKCLITKTMKEIFDKKYSKGNFNKWLNGYYQLGNRITFLEELNKISHKTGLKVRLVLLNFVDDYTYIPTSEEEWKEHYESVFMEMLGKKDVPDDTLIIYFDVK